MKRDVIYNEECLAGMAARLADGSVDLILCDLPYGTTDNAWDSVIDFEALWTQYKRVLKPRGAVVLTAQSPFDKVLAVSNLKWLRHEWIWKKNQATGFLNAKRAPLKEHEMVLVFSRFRAPYRPQGTIALDRPVYKRPKKDSLNYGGKPQQAYFQTVTNYPRTVLEFPSVHNAQHPTQKPIALFEYLIRTYSDPGDLVLDNCMGSGTTAVAAINTGRHFIGFERDSNYCRIARERICAARQTESVELRRAA